MAERDGALNKERSEAYNNAKRLLAEALKGVENAAVLEGSFAKQYRENLLRIALVFDHPAGRAKGDRQSLPEDKQAFCSIIADKLYRYACSASYLDGPAFADREAGEGWQQQLVLVCDVELVKLVKREFAPWEGLNLIKDVVNYLLPGFTGLGYSVEGAFRRFPVSEKGEFDSVSPNAAVILDHDPIGVIEGDTYVVNCVADDRGHVCGKLDTKFVGWKLPLVRVGLRERDARIVDYVGGEGCLQLVDVIVGPFEL